MAHTHDVYDMENHFEINGSSRFIKETSETKLVVVQGDHKSEVLTFKMPRYIDGHDMTLCNKIRIHYINLDTKTNNKSADVYEVTDLTLCEECEDVLTFTWTIEAPATKYSGTLSFLVKFECTEGENVLYQWNTAKYVSVNVLAGIDNGEEFVDKYSNVLEEWYNELTRGADTIEELNQQALAEIEIAKEDAKKDIQKHSNDTYEEFISDVNKKAEETLESIPEDYTALTAEVSQLSSDIEEQLKKTFEYGVAEHNIANSPSILLLSEGINAYPHTLNTKIVGDTLDGFDTYYFYAWENSLSVYFSETELPDYLSISTLENPTTGWIEPEVGSNALEIYGDNPIRYRNLDGNLPTKSNPLLLSKGTMCALTVTHGTSTILYVENQPTNLLNNDIRLNNEQLEQIGAKTKCVVEFASESDENSSPNALNIYIPTKVGYVKYVFAHTVKADINADVWRLANAYATDDLFNVRYALTSMGEWECALHIAEREDFSGGRLHGDEVMTGIVFFMDGTIFTPAEISKRTEFDEIRIIQTSTLYDPNDNTTEIAIHTSEHIFKNSRNDRDITINQTIKWLGNYSLTNCYLAMFPLTKNVASYVYTNIDYTSEKIVSNMNKNGATRANVYSESSGVLATFAIDKYVDGLEGGNRLLITDNSSDDYNKCYYVCCSNAEVKSGTLWQTETLYNVQISK